MVCPPEKIRKLLGGDYSDGTALRKYRINAANGGSAMRRARPKLGQSSAKAQIFNPHVLTLPPSTAMVWPVTKSESALARK
ncbi:MAG: hypothetical protein WBE48_16945, partial [Xanthobacteraceae bacterium]